MVSIKTYIYPVRIRIYVLYNSGGCDDHCAILVGLSLKCLFALLKRYVFLYSGWPGLRYQGLGSYSSRLANFTKISGMFLFWKFWEMFISTSRKYWHVNMLIIYMFVPRHWLIKATLPFLPSPPKYETSSSSQGCQIFVGTWYQNRKNVSNEHKMYPMVII
jgi:hypothetical protein